MVVWAVWHVVGWCISSSLLWLGWVAVYGYIHFLRVFDALYPPKTSGKRVCVVICCPHLLHELGLWGVVCVVWCVVWSDVVCGVPVCRMLPSSLAQTWFISYCMRCMMCILEWCGVWGMSSLVLYCLLSCRLWRTLITLWPHLDFSLGTGLDNAYVLIFTFCRLLDIFSCL